MIYALVADNPTNNAYWLSATLEPDLPESERAELELALALLSPHGTSPALDFPTDPVVNAALSYRWALPEGFSTPTVQALWNSFQVDISSPLGQAVAVKELVEHSGVRGAVTFTLSDGLSLVSELVLDASPVGPWDGGPVPAQVEAGHATLKNAIGLAVDVVGLVATRARRVRSR
jgi:hypothetical protein